MTTTTASRPLSTPLPDASRCPGCSAALTGHPAGACPSCGLRLRGPEAERLWQVDVELLSLDGARGRLLAERRQLLTRLGAPTGAATASAGAPPARMRAAVSPTPEWTPRRVQNLLLLLGGLLLAVAAVVFTAVTYDRLGAGGRAAILLALTIAAATAAPTLLRRGLTTTAETVATITLVLAALDAYGLRTLGFAEIASGLTYAAGSAAVIAVAAGGYARIAPLHVLRCAAIVSAQLPVPLLLIDRGASTLTSGLTLAALAALDLGALGLLRARMRADLTGTLVVAATVVASSSLLAALAAADQRPAGAYAVLAVAAVLAGGALLAPPSWLRIALSAAAVPLLAVAAVTTARGLSEVQLPLVLAAVALLVAVSGTQLPVAWRPGPLLGALLVSGAAVLGVLEQLVTGLLLPLSWLQEPWSRTAGSSARESLGVDATWDGTLVTVAVPAVAALTVLAAGMSWPRRRIVGAFTGALGVLSLALLPLGLDLPFHLTLAYLLAVAAAGFVTVLALAPRISLLERHFGLGGGTVLTLLAVAWSVAEENSTLVVLPVATLLAVAVATCTTPASAESATSATARSAADASIATALAGLLGAASLAAYGAHFGLAADQVGGLLLIAVAVSAAAATVLPAIPRLGAEAAALTLATTAAALSAIDPGWFSWVLAGIGLLALATALRPDRHAVGYAGGLLLSASSWVRLVDADVTAPEPYVVPLALAAFTIGALRRRSRPQTRSWSAYGPALTLLLVPSLVASFDDSTATRALLVGAAAIVVLLLGARNALQAPLLVGAAVLAVDAVQLLAPYAAALPRWSTLGAAGLLLVGVGATYEQRRRDLDRLRTRYDNLA